MTLDDIENVYMETLYHNILNNIDTIIINYDHVLNPNNNNTTLKYINSGYNNREAYALSFMTTVLLYLQINEA